MYIAREDQYPNIYKVKPMYAVTSNNNQNTGYVQLLNVSGKGWFLSAFQHVGDDDGMTGYIRIDVDGVTKVNDMILYRTVEFGGEPHNLVLPIRFETSLVIYHRVASVNTGVGTTVMYDLD